MRERARAGEGGREGGRGVGTCADINIEVKVEVVEIAGVCAERPTLQHTCQ